MEYPTPHYAITMDLQLNTHDSWKYALHDTLREKPETVIQFEDTTIPAATIWAGCRVWVDCFRSLELSQHGRIGLCLEESPAFVQVLLACIWDAHTVFLIHPSRYQPSLAETLDLNLIIHNHPGDYCLSPTSNNTPDTSTFKRVRPCNRHECHDARVFVQSSGTSHAPKWVGLSLEGIGAVINSHLQHLRWSKPVLLSHLPWTHAFGLVLDLFMNLFTEAVIYRCNSLFNDLETTIGMAIDNHVTHLCTVPIVIQKLSEIESGRELLNQLEDGIVGGAPISSPVAETLKHTRLRVGYGLTEASPGIALGERGEIQPCGLGRPLGCDIKVDENQQLWFQGPNKFCGVWGESGYKPADEGWYPTGDLVNRSPDGSMTLLGRTDDRFKLSNGKWIDPLPIEERLIREFPHLSRIAILPNANHLSFDLYYAPHDAEIKKTDIVAELGSLGRFLENIYPHKVSSWPQSPKGTTRRRMLEKIQI